MNIPELKVMKDPEVFGEIFKVVKGPYCWGKPYLGEGGWFSPTL